MDKELKKLFEQIVIERVETIRTRVNMESDRLMFCLIFLSTWKNLLLWDKIDDRTIDKFKNLCISHFTSTTQIKNMINNMDFDEIKKQTEQIKKHTKESNKIYNEAIDLFFSELPKLDKDYDIFYDWK